MIRTESIHLLVVFSLKDYPKWILITLLMGPVSSGAVFGVRHVSYLSESFDGIYRALW